MANINAQNRNYFWLTIIATLLALTVIMLGAYTRLKDAGLGCPDWPGCYGQLVVPHTQVEILEAKQLFPAQAVVAAKAWPEMVHRYFAGTLGLIILVLAIWAIIRRSKYPKQLVALPVILVLIVIFQDALGRWTVTLKLLPLVVMGHLLGGMTVTALLWALALNSGELFPNRTHVFTKLRPWAILGLIIVALQIFLGGWTTANYASLACADFPTCHGLLFSPMHWHRAFNFLSPIGANYQGGALNMAARETIQMMHRYIGAITGIYVGILSLYLMSAKKAKGLRGIGWTILSLLILQICLGIMNVILLLPLHVAVAHNGVAALLLLSMVTLIYKLYAKPRSV